MKDTLTNDIYTAHLDPRVVAMMQLPAGLREIEASRLNDLGLIIDRAIMLYGWDPSKTMRERLQYGLPWIPNAFQPQLKTPWTSAQGESPTDMSKPWDRAVITSTDADDYPPFSAPKPIPTPSHSLVLADYGNGSYLLDQSALFINGKPILNEGDSFQNGDVTLYLHKSLAGLGLLSCMGETAAYRTARIAQEGGK